MTNANLPTQEVIDQVESAVICAIFNDAGELLLGKTHRYGNLAPPVMVCRPGESLLEAVARVVKRNTGCDIKEAVLFHSAPIADDIEGIDYFFKVTIEGEVTNASNLYAAHLYMDMLGPNRRTRYAQSLSDLMNAITTAGVAEATSTFSICPTVKHPTQGEVDNTHAMIYCIIRDKDGKVLLGNSTTHNAVNVTVMATNKGESLAETMYRAVLRNTGCEIESSTLIKVVNAVNGEEQKQTRYIIEVTLKGAAFNRSPSLFSSQTYYDLSDLPETMKRSKGLCIAMEALGLAVPHNVPRNAMGVFEFTTVHCLILNDENELLVQDHAKLPMLKVPSAKVRTGETIVEALHRSVLEATGCKVLTFNELGMSTHTEQEGTRHMNEIIFGIRVEGTITNASPNLHLTQEFVALADIPDDGKRNHGLETAIVYAGEIIARRNAKVILHA